MFERILIANRGEIACRVIDTAHRLGVSCVAVYSDADAQARHVEMSDVAVRIGGPAPSESYLLGDVIIQAALDTGAQAIHPGYGFLSENPDFVEAVEKAGLVFIGPSADAIRAMGLKDAAKALMDKAGVPVVPGYHGADQDDRKLAAEAKKIGFPVLVKAVAGGGGKGMRKVDHSSGFQEALTSARSEAANAFGNDQVLIEKFVEKPRHIEVQVFGDGKKSVHLFERDCSLQRRHQKVIEEAPAPGMTAKMRKAMGKAAVQAAEAIGYSGAATVEFIVDGSKGLRPDAFWFMEMNTRLQVEHPVTEAITGIDLVEWQLRVASGEQLPLSQDGISFVGHAIEARLYAEDVRQGFLPATGTLEHLRFGAMARIDTGVRELDAISPYYDPMIAKLITHGPSREVALSRLRAALRETEIAGTITNLTFLEKLMDNPEFSSGHVDTALIDRNLEDLTQVDSPDDQVRAIATLAATELEPKIDRLRGFALWDTLEQGVKLCEDGVEIDARLSFPTAETVRVSVGECEHDFSCVKGGWVASDTRDVRARRIGSKAVVFAPAPFEFAIPDPLATAETASYAGNVIEAPMPGLVKTVFATQGQTVVAGDRLALLEAMKMEHVLTAARDGTIAEVLVSSGDQVEAGAALIRLEDDA